MATGYKILGFTKFKLCFTAAMLLTLCLLLFITGGVENYSNMYVSSGSLRTVIMTKNNELSQLLNLWARISETPLPVILRNVPVFVRRNSAVLQQRGQRWDVQHILLQNKIGFDIHVDWTKNGKTHLTLTTHRYGHNDDSYTNFTQYFGKISRELKLFGKANPDIMRGTENASVYEYGGARFEIIANGSDHISRCSVKDYYNGTYASVCHHCGNINITVFLAFGDYLQYLYSRVAHWKVIWSGSVMSELDISNIPAYCKAERCKRADYFNNADIMYSKVENEWHLVLSGCLVPTIDSRTENIIKTAFKIIYTGDSHVRGLFIYTLKLFGREIPRDKDLRLIKHSSWYNLDYIWAPRIGNVLDVLSNMFQIIGKHAASPSKHPIVFIMDGAHHHVSEGGFQKYQDGIDKYFIQVEELIRKIGDIRRTNRKVNRHLNLIKNRK